MATPEGGERGTVVVDVGTAQLGPPTSFARQPGRRKSVALGRGCVKGWRVRRLTCQRCRHKQPGVVAPFVGRLRLAIAQQLALKPGMVVADIGFGGGWFLTPVGAALGDVLMIDSLCFDALL